ncbi:MAG: hypothetical protein U0992_13655 [Planctomycetaceae bacterium]
MPFTHSTRLPGGRLTQLREAGDWTARRAKPWSVRGRSPADRWLLLIGRRRARQADSLKCIAVS